MLGRSNGRREWFPLFAARRFQWSMKNYAQKSSRDFKQMLPQFFLVFVTAKNVPFDFYCDCKIIICLHLHLPEISLFNAVLELTSLLLFK